MVNVEMPKTLAAEHEQLHAELGKATDAGGSTGEAARVVARLLHAHLVKEAKYALPLLGLLPLLGTGHVPPDVEAVLELTEKLQAELPGMLEEHDAIIGALEHLAAAARQEDRPEYVHFAERLRMHARSEEEVLYPAALLIGQYLKLRRKERA